eukprot:6794966-Pyramimonas_sp.AAC.1
MRPAHPVQRFVALLFFLPALHPPSTALRGPIGSPYRGSQCYRRHASCTPSTALRGPKGSPTEGHISAVRMRSAHPAQRFVAP